MESVDGTVPTTTPTAVYSSERWDPGDGDEMQWNFPATVGRNLEVRLYFANQYDGTASAGSRVFDVSVDGNTVLNNYDIAADVGHRVGTMKAFNVTSDGIVDIDFGHVVENPLINAIEIVDLNAPPSAAADEAVRRSYDGNNVGAATTMPDVGIQWSRARGAFLLDGQLYTAWADGHLYRRTFNGTTFGPAQDVNLNGLTQFSDEMQRMTGMFYKNGRIYYTLLGSSQLHMRYFSTHADVVGAGLKELQPFTVSDSVDGVDWSQVRGMFLAGNKVYWSNKTTGDLHSINWNDGAPGNGSPVAGTGDVVSGPGVDGQDWRYRAMFARQTVANQAPNAVIGASCANLQCNFTSTGSTDDGSIVLRSWNFGDGGTSTMTSPPHTYANPGTYTVTLTVTDDDGATDTDTQQVQVSNASAISFVGANRDSNGGSAVNHNVNVPAGVQAGDGLVMAFSDNAPAQSITAPAGWTQVATQSTNGMTTRIWERVATAGMAGQQVRVTTGAAARGTLVLSAYRGTDSSRSGGRRGDRGRDRDPCGPHHTDGDGAGGRVGGVVLGGQDREHGELDGTGRTDGAGHVRRHRCRAHVAPVRRQRWHGVARHGRRTDSDRVIGLGPGGHGHPGARPAVTPG